MGACKELIIKKVAKDESAVKLSDLLYEVIVSELLD